ncbi:MAG: hypothetical protein KC613_03215 [Myxococcales bacterium]|nr:hypothetical protein [Myxococcales bacterium]
MSEGAIFLNSGPLFNAERLETIEDVTEWGELGDDVRVAYTMIREAFEKHATLLAGNPSVEETRFYMINPTLYALNFSHSVAESVSLGDDQVVRVDYTCFANANDFYEAEPARGSLGFFRPAITIVGAEAWGSSFDEAPDDGDEPAVLPAQRLDVLLRTTGRDYGILSNGCDWRLYHRATSSQNSTFFQADMIAAMKSEFEDFKRFYLLFNRDAFIRDDTGMCFLDRLLQ